MGGGASRSREDALRKELAALQEARRKEAEQAQATSQPPPTQPAPQAAPPLKPQPQDDTKEQQQPQLLLPTVPAHVALPQLPAVIRDLHGGMPPDIASPPMRLMRIAAVLKWTSGIMVYEDVDPADCEELPYSDVSEAQWGATVVLSWRWGAPKPATAQPGFSPMTPAQFAALQAALGRMAGSGFEFVWIDWSCVPQYSAPSMVEVLRSKVFYARARAMLVIPTFHPLPTEGIVRPLLARAQQLLTEYQPAAPAAPAHTPTSETTAPLSATTGAAAAAAAASCDAGDAAAAAAAVGGMLAGGSMGCREYLHRVWTLAERMARYGRAEPLSAWVGLEAWLGMLADAVMAAAGVANGCGGGGGAKRGGKGADSALVLYKRILDACSSSSPAAAGVAAAAVGAVAAGGAGANGEADSNGKGGGGKDGDGGGAGGMLDAVVPLLASAAATGSLLGEGSRGLDERFAELLRLGAAVWRSSRLEEAPSEAWLRDYLGDMQAGVYQAWSDADRVWAVYSYFCWKKVDPSSLPEAIQDLVRVAGGGSDHVLAVGGQLGLGAQGVAAIAGALGLGQLRKQQLALARDKGRQLLSLAREGGDAAAVRALLAEGATRDEMAQGDTPFTIAAANGHLDAVKLLLAAGANCKTRDLDRYTLGKTPLRAAAENGHASVMSVLLAAGVDCQSDEAVLALIATASNGRSEAMGVLLAAGTDKDRQMDNMTPLRGAAKHGRVRAVSILLEAGADKEARDKAGNTALLVAAQHGKDECVQVLLDAGADTQAANTDGYTALMWAAKEGHEEMLTDLLAAGASVNVANKDGVTPLMWAAQYNHLEVARALVAAGADKSPKNKAGERALDLASGKGMQVLLQPPPGPEAAVAGGAKKKKDK
ncbi:hypothetical protein HYH02_003276 [Chlamydomonas schloesseri]|uniref:Heterokaryon incompatibility domain-containing protein n=1 Tax=Chlamydomonas schloesseri TaxID=2026947 RepID=A0A835WQJ4_9CHLO|nr:hypothetical protein HYH02_003276 [Chlamydomonas schloesseri]|eukprot:KAG2452249.1 hypothetical protein HYH02_003276 [Chlamydomonas schloesseri]